MEEQKDDRFSSLSVKESSMDVSSLNNLVVSMRPRFKKAKIFAVKRITRQMRKFKDRKGSEKQCSVYGKKLQKLEEELTVIKTLKHDDVIKFALSNEIPFEKLVSQVDLSRRAMGRIATQQCMQEYVMKWRSEHDDWKSLAAFILSKNTGRRFKRKKEPSSEENPAVEVPKTNNVGVEVESNTKKEVRVESENAKVRKRKISDAKTDTSVEISTEPNSALSNSEDDETSSALESDEEPEEDHLTISSKPVERERQAEPSIKRKPSESSINIASPANKEMVIKKFNIDDLNSDDDLVVDPEVRHTSADFLFQPNASVSKPKRKDAFFMDSDGESVSEENEEMEEETNQGMESYSEDEGFFNKNTDFHKKRMFENTFVGSMSRNKEGSRRLQSRQENKEFSERSQSGPHRDRTVHSKTSAFRAKKLDNQSFRTQDNKRDRGKNSTASTTGKLHPSWEASKKRKLETSGIAAFEGKKITFDDD